MTLVAKTKGVFQHFTGKSGKSTLANYRITLLCGIITLLVLRGTTTSRSGGVSSDDSAQGLKQFPGQDVLVSKSRKLAEDSHKVATLWKPTAHFRLGPKISNWDGQRALWLRHHPNANATVAGKPRVMLVTGSQPQQCENPLGTFQLLKALKNKVDYCRLHDIDIYYNFAILDKAMNSFWSKLPLLRKLMLTHPQVEWMWWMDSDALFTDMTFDIPFETYADYNMIINGGDEGVYTKKSWLGLNAGIFLIRNCQWSLDLIDEWAAMGPRGPVRTEFGKVFGKTLTDRRDYEADDQSALVYLMNADRERWGRKVMLEDSIRLHGYWLMLVERYEEFMAKGRPGDTKGEFRWPFVTHFVGCKPCGKGGDESYAVDRCLKHMDRAFNFADNQILEHFGFRHVSLQTTAVHRVEQESADPLGLMDELDLAQA